jgi:hypothetical protein
MILFHSAVGFHTLIYTETYFEKARLWKEGSFLLAFDHSQKDIAKALFILKKTESKGEKNDKERSSK